MSNIISLYNDFFCSGNTVSKESLMKLSADVSGIGGNTVWIDKAVSFLSSHDGDDIVYFRDAVDLIAMYLHKYGYSYKHTKQPFNKGNLWDVLRVAPAYLRIMLDADTIEDVIKSLCGINCFPKMNFNTDEDTFDGEFHFRLKSGLYTNDDLIRFGFITYLIGFPLSDLTILKRLANQYARSETIMESVVYECVCEDWFSTILYDLSVFGLSVPEWCIQFDGTWMDPSNQIDDGFISIYNPLNPKHVVCISVMYPGEYFVTNMLLYQNIYELGYLGTIRFVEKNVPVRLVSKGSTSDEVSNRLLTVPVYYADDEERLLSDLVSDDFTYHEVFWHNVGG